MWKITSPTDQVKTTSDTPQLQFTGQINWGPFYLAGAATGAGNTRGSFSDTFFSFPITTSETANSGSNTAFSASAGFNFINLPGLTVGAFGVYDVDFEALYGNTTFSGSQFSLLETRSQAAGGGLIVKDTFTVGSVPFVLSGSVAGLADNVKSGLFNGDGGGWQANATLTFPLVGPLRGNLFGQYTAINASGNVMGVPLTFDNQTWQFGGGVSVSFPVDTRRVAPFALGPG